MRRWREVRERSVERLARPIGPRRFAALRSASEPGTVIVCAGDSITHGLMSANYVRLLDRRFRNWDCTVVNAGVGGDLAYNLLKRLDAVVACEPDVVTVLIGTNDVAAHVSDAWRDEYLRRQDLPQEPTLRWYEATLEEILERLQSETTAHIACLDLPMLGEDLDSLHNQRVCSYNDAIRRVCDRKGVPVLPLHERLTASRTEVHHAPQFDGSKRLMVRALLQRVVLRRSYDAISASHGFELLTDHVHLNDSAATIVADVIERYVAQTLAVGIEVS
jgi:acyl-CoA thioesterase-1